MLLILKIFLLFIYHIIVYLKSYFVFIARSHKFGRQGQATYDDEDESGGDYSYGYGASGYSTNFANESYSDEDDEDYDGDSYDESTEETTEDEDEEEDNPKKK